MRSQSASWLGRILRRFLSDEHVNLSILALIIGAAVGASALAFRAAIGAIQQVGFGFSSELVITGARGLPWWQVLLVPAGGGLLVGLFLRYAIRGGRAHGVAYIVEASGLHRSRMPLRAGVASIFAAAASIGVGASTGREGPVVHFGASLASWVAGKLHLGPGLSRTLLGCGAAAAVAASFNAPIAGVFFALEVIIGHHALKAFAPIVIASVTGTVIGRIQFGTAPAFVVPENYLISLFEFPAFVLLGVVSAAAAIIFMRAIFFAESVASRSRIPQWLQPACAGIAIGAMAIFLPHILGVGYEGTDAALRAEFALGLLLVLIVAKIAATAISLGFGFAGGVFSPSLFLGALVGGAFGTVAGAVFPLYYSGTPAYALIGTGAVAGAVLGAPMSTILIIFELTGDYAMTIAVMIATAVASVITHKTYGRSFFHMQLQQRGIKLDGGEERELLRSMRVDQVMRQEFVTVPPSCPAAELPHHLHEAPYGELFVVDATDRLHGVLTFDDYYNGADKRDHNEACCAVDLARIQPTMLAASDDLDRALEVMRSEHQEHLPVVSDPEAMTVVGFVHERDIVRAYNQALLRIRAEEHGHR